MRFKKLLMIGVCGIMLNASSVQAGTRCFFGGVMCFFQDVIGAAIAAVVHLAMQHTSDITYDVKQGLKQIQENIGAYQSEGKCGVSASGASGCSLLTEEEGEEIQEEAKEANEESASVIPDSTIKIVEQSESKGDIKKDGSTFDQVRENVYLYMFATDDATVNSDCKCSNGTGSACDTSECAQVRQNDSLVTSSVGASSAADTYLKDVEKNYDNLKDLVTQINSAETISDFVGKMGWLSTYASSAAVDQMALQAYDLRAQSYRNLVASGIENLTEGETK